MVLATSRMLERGLARRGERITSLGTFALKATPWVAKVASSRSGYSGEGVRQKLGVEARVDRLVEVEGRDHLARNVVAQVPDGGVAVVAGTSGEGGYGNDQRGV